MSLCRFSRPGLPVPRFLFSGVGRLRFFGAAGRGFGVRLASIGCFYRPAAFYRPGNCGARFVPRFTQNQHMSALLAERLHPPSLSRVRSTLQIAAHDGSRASWSSPWREHGHSDHPSMETHSFCSALADAPKSIHSHVYGRARAFFDSSERYFRPKATHKRPHPCGACTKQPPRRSCRGPPSRRSSLEHDSVINFVTRTRGARRKLDEVESRGRARGRSSR